MLGYAISILTKLLGTTAMTTPVSRPSLIKRIGLVAYRLLDRMTESAYRHHRAHLFNRYGI
ncbi:hypothetical protein BV504_18150 [Halomonas sp. 'Soap Lake |nr:hypothetical protein B2G49_18305 [Halomonas sp. 'Soap Lake \